MPKLRNNNVVITGTAVAYRPDAVNYYPPNNNVADAYTYRRYLVALTFAQRSFVASIKTSEAKSPEEAVQIAAARAVKAFNIAKDRLGNLMGSAVYEDTPEQRKALRIDGADYRDPWKSLIAA